MKVDDFRPNAHTGRRLVMVGGFLGAGKTTLICGFARWLQARALRVGLVTNDQGHGLLDTVTVGRAVAGEDRRNPGGAVEEVSGGCFCCRLGELEEALRRMDAGVQPDVVVAEPVGSCTDLVATVILPLEKVCQTPFRLAPLSVVVDARRALGLLGGRQVGRSFHRNVGYVFRKQMEEAEWLVVNKTDLLSDEDAADVLGRLSEAYPGRRLFPVCAADGHGTEDWYQAVVGERNHPQPLPELDYERYAEGEALLGWLNSIAHCQAAGAGPFDWGRWLHRLGNSLAGKLESAGHEVGHLKMSVESGGERWRLHQTMGGEEPRLIHESDDLTANRQAQLLVNLRAEGAAQNLAALLTAELAGDREITVRVVEEAAFQPGKPQPTHLLRSSTGPHMAATPSACSGDGAGTGM